jgi:hypothetical protein
MANDEGLHPLSFETHDSWIQQCVSSLTSMQLFHRPSVSNLLERRTEVDFVKKILQKGIGCITSLTTTLQTSALPHESDEVTIFLSTDHEERWFTSVLETVVETDRGDNLLSISILFPQNRIAIKKRQSQIEISLNNLSGLYNSALLESLHGVYDSSVPIQQTLHLLKIWLAYDSHDLFYFEGK